MHYYTPRSTTGRLHHLPVLSTTIDNAFYYCTIIATLTCITTTNISYPYQNAISCKTLKTNFLTLMKRSAKGEFTLPPMRLTAKVVLDITRRGHPFPIKKTISATICMYTSKMITSLVSKLLRTLWPPNQPWNAYLLLTITKKNGACPFSLWTKPKTKP